MTPEEFVGNFLAHSKRYDPQQAHEYYLRTRKLKGRSGGSASSPPPTSGRGAVAPAGQGRIAKPGGKTAEQRRNEAHARVEALNKRLARLKEVLAELVEKAKGASGALESKPDKPASKPDKGRGSGGGDKLTPTQRREARERARDAYEKEKKKGPSKEAKEIEAQIAKVREQIVEMKEKLRLARAPRSQGTAVLERVPSNSKSKTAAGR